MIYKNMLLKSIEDEKNGLDYIYPDIDKPVLKELCKEINKYAGTNFHYLAELVAFYIPGSGRIVVKYIERFSSEGVKGYLIPLIALDKVDDCDKLILELYLHFKASDKYISAPGEPAPAHIYIRYDNAFRTLRPKRLSKEFMVLAHSPRDAFYLPFTMRMLASWKSQEMRQILMSYIDTDWITAEDVGICDDGKVYYPPLEFIRSELKFTAIEGLKYYPSQETTDIMTSLLGSGDRNIELAVKKTLKFLSKKTK